MSFSSIKEGLRRFFLGKVVISGLSFPAGIGSHPVIVRSSRREVPVFSVRSSVKVAEARCARWNGMKVEGQVFDLFISPPSAKNGLPSMGGNVSVKTKGALFSIASTGTTNGLSLMSRLPQTRRNMVSSITDKTRHRDVIALFYPVIKECVVKSALEKESGSLYVWYNPSCQGSPHILCLVSDPGKRPPLSWKWL